MDSVRFCALAPLLGAYHGAVAGWVAEQVKKPAAEQQRSATAAGTSPGVPVPLASLAEIASIAGPSLSVGTSGA